MKLEDGYIKIHISDLLMEPGVLEECAKHATFDKILIEGLVQVMLTDEAQWELDENPWWTVVSYGKSMFEDARMKLIEHIDQAAITQIKALQKERDTYSKYYDEYQTKCIELEQTVWDLKYKVRRLKGEISE